MPVALFISTQHWHSCFQLGSHHIARCFAKRGWKVGFISAPANPLNLIGIGGDAKQRVASWSSGGLIDHETGIWHFVPFAPLPWGAMPLFRNQIYIKFAWALCQPSLAKVLFNAGFYQPLFAYSDHFLHEGLMRAANPRNTIFRRADNLSAFPGAGRDFAVRELKFAKKCDLTICTTSNASAYLREQGVNNVIMVPNGVRLERFFYDAPIPKEYRNETRPIVVYVGASESWLDINLILRGAAELRELCWAVIGPFEGQVGRLLREAGVKVLGPRPHNALAGYLQHAHVGIVPFSLTRYQKLIAEINPLKVFEYAACGLPVVATRGCQYPQDLPTKLTVCDTAEQFLAAVKSSATGPKLPRPDAALFKDYGWSARLEPLFQWLKQKDSLSHFPVPEL